MGPAVSAIIKGVIIDGLMMASARARIEKKVRVIGFHALALLVALIGFIYLLNAASLALQTEFEPWLSALILGCALMVLAIVIWMSAKIRFRRHGKPVRSHEQDVASTVHTIIATILEEIAGQIKDNPKVAMLIAAIAGLFAGRKIH